jgi:hypothetical protein
MLPDSTALADKAVAIIETPGGPPEAATEVDEPHFQILVRGTSINSASTAYQDAKDKAQDVKAALHAITPGTYSGRHYAGIWAQQDPFLFEYDDNQRPVIVTNYRALRSRTT